MTQTSLNTLLHFDLHEFNKDLFTNVKAILDLNNTVVVKELYNYIKKECENKTKMDTSVTDSTFDKKLTDNIHLFWDNYYTYFDN